MYEPMVESDVVVETFSLEGILQLTLSPSSIFHRNERYLEGKTTTVYKCIKNFEFPSSLGLYICVI
jgi:hypothetical protein